MNYFIHNKHRSGNKTSLSPIDGNTSCIWWSTFGNNVMNGNNKTLCVLSSVTLVYVYTVFRISKSEKRIGNFLANCSGMNSVRGKKHFMQTPEL